MKKLTIILTAICVLAMANLAFAQDQYDAGLFFDTAGTQSELTIGPFGQFNLYVLAFDLDGQPFGYEGTTSSSIDWVPSNPTGISVLSATLSGPAPLNVGDNFNWIVGTGGCMVDSAGWFQLIDYFAGHFVNPPVADILFCMGASNPTSFAPAAPGYLRCDGSLQAFGVAQNGQGVYPNGCAVLNPTSPGSIVGTVDSSFGAVKAGF